MPANEEVSVEYFHVLGAVLVVSPTAGQCMGCGVARYNFVNREGRTLCLDCDRKAREGDECARN